MIFLPNDKMNINKFVDTQLPTKGQIFDRTGKRAVSPSGVYTYDELALIGRSLTEAAERFARRAESYERPQSEASKSSADEE